MSIKLSKFLFDIPRLYSQGLDKCKIDVSVDVLKGLKASLVQTPANLKAYDSIVEIVTKNEDVDIAEWKAIFPIGVIVLDDDRNEIIVKKEDISSFLLEIGETHLYSNSSISIELLEDGEVQFNGYEKALAVPELHEFIYEVSEEKEIGFVPTNLEVIVTEGGADRTIKIKGKAEVPKLILRDKFKKNFCIKEIPRTFVECVLTDREETEEITFKSDTNIEELKKLEDSVDVRYFKGFMAMCEGIENSEDMTCTLNPNVLGLVLNVNGDIILVKFQSHTIKIHNYELSKGESISFPLEYENGEIAVNEEGQINPLYTKALYSKVLDSEGKHKMKRKRFYSDMMVRLIRGDKRPIVRVSGIANTPQLETKPEYLEFFGEYEGGYEEVNLSIETTDDQNLDKSAIDSLIKVLGSIGNKEIELSEILELIPPSLRNSLPKNNTLAAIAFTILHNEGVK